MEVENVDGVEALQQVFAHLAVNNTVDKAVVGDVSEYSGAVFVDKVLSVTDKLDVVVGERLNVAFVQLLFIVGREFFYPFAFVVAAHTVGRVAHHHHYGGVAFNAVGFVGLGAQPAGKEGTGVGVVLFEAVGEVDAEALVGFCLVPGLRE